MLCNHTALLQYTLSNSTMPIETWTKFYYQRNRNKIWHTLHMHTAPRSATFFFVNSSPMIESTNQLAWLFPKRENLAVRLQKSRLKERQKAIWSLSDGQEWTKITKAEEVGIDSEEINVLFWKEKKWRIKPVLKAKSRPNKSRLSSPNHYNPLWPRMNNYS